MSVGWVVVFRDRVWKRQVPRLPKKVKLLVDQAIVDLEDEGPFPFGWNVKEIEKGTCRMRLKYNWRLIYAYSRSAICIEVIYVGSKEGVSY